MIALLCAAFATYRLAILVAEEEGPWALAQKFRNTHQADDWVGRGIRCPACVGFWLALPLTVFALLFTSLDVWAWPLYWLAVAGAARWLWRVERAD